MRNNRLLSIMLVAAAGTTLSASPQQVNTAKVHVATPKVAPHHSLQSNGPHAMGDYDLVYDTMHDIGNGSGWNLSWVEPVDYTPGGAGGSAYLTGLGSVAGEFWDAPWIDDPAECDANIPTDIAWDVWAADLSVWGAPGTMNPITMYDITTAICNNVARTVTFNIGMMNLDGDTIYGPGTPPGVINVSYGELDATWCYLTLTTGIDLLYNGLAFDAPDAGYYFVDFPNDTQPDDSGLGMAISGGDLTQPNPDGYPSQDEILTRNGYDPNNNDPEFWVYGTANNDVDENWDGEPGISYLDVFNTQGCNDTLILWNFEFDDSAGRHRVLTRDFPITIYAQTGAVTCAGDLDGDGDTDQSDLGILLAAFNTTGDGDLDGDGDTDQSDLGILLADFGCTP
ncbi:MAG TPA: hypothetical protein ENJ06_05525 [Phycisphaeraceae bacterium]|nr:hypothetical protein [Phycisphaeraceae bacterium]